jgi:hypothetical protein
MDGPSTAYAGISLQDVQMTDGDNRCWHEPDGDDGVAGRLLTWDDFLQEYIDRPTWRQVIGNALLRLAIRIGTSYTVD